MSAPTVSVPVEPAPAGAMIAPAAGVTLPPIVPVPASVVAPAMLTLEDAGRLPFTTRAPPETVVLPVYVWLAFRMSVPRPALVKPPPPVPAPFSVNVDVALLTSRMALLAVLMVKLRLVLVLPPV